MKTLPCSCGVMSGSFASRARKVCGQGAAWAEGEKRAHHMTAARPCLRKSVRGLTARFLLHTLYELQAENVSEDKGRERESLLELRPFAGVSHDRGRLLFRARRLGALRLPALRRQRVLR